MTGLLRITLLGTGSSGGVPRIGGDWGVCDPLNPRNRRSRCSAVVERIGAKGVATRILIDTSPDLREQALAADVSVVDAVVFSHDHADQTHGLDDARVLAINAQRTIPAFLDAPTWATLGRKFDYCFEGKGGYPPIIERQPLIEAFKPFRVDGEAGPISVLPLDQQHGRIRSLGFRIGPLAYCNDVNLLPERTLQALRGVELLVVDALRYKPHPTHAHVAQALEWIAMIGPERAVLTNLHVDLDYATLRRDLPDGVEPAYDGMVLKLPY